MHQRSTKSGSVKTSASAENVLTENGSSVQNIYTDSLKQLPIQRKSVDENDEDTFDDEELEDEDVDTSEPPAIQKKCTECEEEDKVAQRSLIPFIQTKTEDVEYVTDGTISKKIQSTKGGGQALPETTKSFMQNRFGSNFSDVRIHTSDYATDLSTQLNAQAFTVGKDIYFNAGQFEPATTQGQKLIAHELTHTIQQSNNRVSAQPKVQRSFWSFIKKAAGSVWSGIKKVGEWIGKGAKWVWNAVKWVGGQVIDKIAGVFQRFAYWMTQLPARVYRLVSTLWKGLKTFKPWTLKWWKSLGEVDTWKNFLKWIGTVALQSLEIGGIGEAYETIQDFIKFNTRTLSASELKAGKSVFWQQHKFRFCKSRYRSSHWPTIYG